MPIHPKYKTPSVLIAKEKAELAVAAFETAGGEIYHERSTGYMSVNVKSYANGFAPELKQDDNIKEQCWEWEQRDFWDQDMKDAEGSDQSRWLLGTDTHHFPKVSGGGRGGHLLFDGVEHSDIAVSLIYHEHDIEDIVVDQYNDWASDYYSEEEYDEHVHEDTIYGFGCIQTFFEDATKWVEYVKRCQKNRENNLAGKSEDWLQLQVDNIRWELFDFTKCTAVFQWAVSFVGEPEASCKVTVSWPQHEREFLDVTWGVASERAGSHSDQYSGTHVFSFEMDLNDFTDALAPEVAHARSLLNKGR